MPATQEVRKGLAAIKESAERKGGNGEFKPFCPNIGWSNDEEKYILVLSVLDELQEYKVHEWVQTGTHQNSDGDTKPDFDFFISRKDPSIGEAYDELEERLGNQPRNRFIGVGVELVPVTETKAGRGGKSTEEIVGFEVATDTYTTKDDDDEEIDVDYPLIGIISLSSSNFWGWLGNYQEKREVTETPMSVTRSGKDKDTRYDFIPMTDAEVDLTPLVELAEGLSYIRETDDFEDVMGEAESSEDPHEAALIIADYLLATRITELSDGERYHEVVSAIDELPPSKWGNKKGAKKGGRSAKKDSKPSRATRSTARSSSRAKQSDAEPEAEAPAEDSGSAEESPGFKNLRERARSRAKAQSDTE